MGDSEDVLVEMPAECRSSETGSAGKTQDREFEKAAKFTDFLPFSVPGSSSQRDPKSKTALETYICWSP